MSHGAISASSPWQVHLVNRDMAIGGSSELKDSQWGIKKKRNFLKNGMLRTTKTWKSGFFSTCFSFLWVLTCWNCARHDIFESKLHVSCSVLQKGAEEVIAELQVEFEVWWHLSLLGKLAIFSWLHQRRVRLSTQFGEEWESTVIQYDWAGVHRGWHPTQLSRDDHKPRHYWIPPKKKNQEIPRESLPTLTVAQLRSTYDMRSFASATNRCSSEAFGKANRRRRKARCCVCV